MLAITILGAQQSGKTTLARKCVTEHCTYTPLRPDSPRAFHVVTPATMEHVQVLDPKPNARPGSMARELSRHRIAAALLVLPRDGADPHHARGVQEWATFARRFTPCPQLAVVVTKTHTPAPVLPLHRFEQGVLDTMRTSQVDRIFYTDAASQAPLELRGWLGDMLYQAQENSDRAGDASPCWAPRETPALGTLPLLAGHAPSPKDAQRSCDHCRVM